LPNRQVNAPLRRSNDLPYGFSRPPILSRIRVDSAPFHPCQMLSGQECYAAVVFGGGGWGNRAPVAGVLGLTRFGRRIWYERLVCLVCHLRLYWKNEAIELR